MIRFLYAWMIEGWIFFRYPASAMKLTPCRVSAERSALLNASSDSNCWRLRWSDAMPFTRAIWSAPASGLLLITRDTRARRIVPDLTASRIAFRFDPLPEANTAMFSVPVNVCLLIFRQFKDIQQKSH